MQDFDKQIRALLEDAEERVPSGVWNAVSRDLDKASEKVVPVLWWRRAAVAVAVAAAAVVGVFLFRGENNSTFQPYHQVNTIARAGDGIGISLVEPGDLKPFRNLLAYAPEAESSAPETGNATVPQSVSSSAPESVSEMFKPETEKKEAASEKTPAASENPSAGEADRQLRELAFEDSKEEAVRPASFLLGGNVLSNGSPSMRKPGPYRTIASAPTKTGISDREGESFFGIPMSIGLGVRIPLAGHLSLGTGVEYTFLSRTFTGTYTEIENGVAVNTITGDIDNYQHYLGIPVNIYYHILDNSSTRFYVYGGGTVEKSISNHYRVHSATGDVNWSDPAAGLQFSVGAGLGVEFLFSDSFGLFVDPGVRYYFNCGQPRSIRTAQPLMMNFEIGMRIGL